MSLKAPPKQSCVNRLPPEIVAHIFYFFESTPPVFESYSSPPYTRNVAHSRGVCQSWRGVSLQAGDYAAHGILRLEGLLGMLESRPDAKSEDRAVRNLHISGSQGDLQEQTSIVCRLLEMSVNSLRLLDLDLLMYYYTPETTSNCWTRILHSVCEVTRLEHLKLGRHQRISIEDILHISAACRSLLHLDLTQTTISYPTSMSPPLSPSLPFLHHKLRHLGLSIDANPWNHHLLASLLASGTVQSLDLKDATAGGFTGTILSKSLPLLLQHAHNLKTFSFRSYCYLDDGDDMVDDPFLLYEIVPLLKNCERLALPAYSLYSTDPIKSWKVDPSHLPSLTRLELSGLASSIRGLEMWSPVVQARGGVSLVEIEADFGPTFEGLWKPFAKLCGEKGVELTVYEEGYAIMERGILNPG